MSPPESDEETYLKARDRLLGVALYAYLGFFDEDSAHWTCFSRAREEYQKHEAMVAKFLAAEAHISATRPPHASISATVLRYGVLKLPWKE